MCDFVENVLDLELFAAYSCCVSVAAAMPAAWPGRGERLFGAACLPAA